MSPPVVLVRERSLLRAHAPAVVVAGLVLFGVSFLFLGLVAGESQEVPVDPSAVVVRADGLAVQSHALPALRPNEVVEATFAFPRGTGDAYLLTCTDLERYVAGGAPLGPLETRRDVASGRIVHESGHAKFRAETGKTPGLCTGLHVAFGWPTDGAAWQAGAPLAKVVVRDRPLDSAAGRALYALSVAGAALALVGGLSLGSARWLRAYDPLPAAADEDEGTAETLMRLANRAVEWLERTRRYLLVSGLLGVFLWYPILIPYAFRAGRSASLQPWAPWALAGGALLFLVALTVLWARQFLALDAELAGWRERMGRLREREARFLEELTAMR